MRNLLTYGLSLILLAATAGGAWLLLDLSNNTTIERNDPGNAAEVTVPDPAS